MATAFFQPDDGSKRFKQLPGKKELMVNSRDRFVRTPLHLAASNGNVEILWQLLRFRARFICYELSRWRKV
jgi:ankyrin repeat protein